MLHKNIKVLFIIATISFYSCQEKEESTVQDFSSFLDSYRISKTSDGDYLLNYQTPKNVSSSIQKISEGSHRVELFRKKEVPVTQHSQTFPFKSTGFEIGFALENGIYTPLISIEDRNLANNQTKKTDSELLTSYEITNVEEDMYQLDFEVADGVAVNPTYNDSLGVYEVHLTKDANTRSDTEQRTHTVTYTATIEGGLHIHFVNYFERNTSKTISGRRYPIIDVQLY